MMTLRIIGLFLLFQPCGTSTNNEGAPDNVGTEFIFAYLTPLGLKDSDLMTLVSISGDVFNTWNYSNTIQLSAINNRFHHTYNLTSVNPVQTHHLNCRQGCLARSDSIQKRTFHLKSTENVPFTVYGLSLEHVSSDGFLAFPVDVIGVEYVIIGPEGQQNEGKHNNFAVVASQNNTEVVIFHRNSTLLHNMTLNRLDAFQKSERTDFTGYRIRASKPVAVMSGAEGIWVPKNFNSHDAVIEMLPPLNILGRNFVLGKLEQPCKFDNCTSFYKLVASSDNTTIEWFTSSNMNRTGTLNQGEFLDITPHFQDATYLRSSKPILVAQFAASAMYTGVDSGDPFFTLIPQIEAYSSSYHVVTCLERMISNYFNIAINKSEIGGLRIDAKPVIVGYNITCQDVPNIPFMACIYEIDCADKGTNIIVSVEHINPTVTFSLLTYGFGHRESYGFIGGMRLANNTESCTPSNGFPGDGLDNDCDGKIDEELHNSLDDDGDGQVDEDLATIAPTVVLPPHYFGYSCNRNSSYYTPSITGFPTVKTVSKRCHEHPPEFILSDDQFEETKCSLKFKRYWKITDSCGNVNTAGYQIITITRPMIVPTGIMAVRLSYCGQDPTMAMNFFNDNQLSINQTCENLNPESVISQSTFTNGSTGNEIWIQREWIFKSECASSPIKLNQTAVMHVNRSCGTSDTSQATADGQRTTGTTPTTTISTTSSTSSAPPSSSSVPSVSSGSYLFIFLENFDNSAGGGLLDTDMKEHCDLFWFTGLDMCDMAIQLCVELSYGYTNEFTACSTKWIDLGKVTSNDNNATFSTGRYGGWSNPMRFPLKQAIEGFQIKLKVDDRDPGRTQNISTSVCYYDVVPGSTNGIVGCTNRRYNGFPTYFQIAYLMEDPSKEAQATSLFD